MSDTNTRRSKNQRKDRENPRDVRGTIPYIWNFLVAFGIPAIIFGLLADEVKQSYSNTKATAKAYRSTIETDTVAAYSAFLEAHPTGRRAEDVTKRKALAIIRDFKTMEKVVYELAKQADNISAYRIYLTLYKEGHSVQSAGEQLIRLQGDIDDFNEARSTDTIAAYDIYLGTHAHGKYVYEVHYRRRILESNVLDDEAYSTATEADVTYMYRAYLMAFPEGRHRDKVEEQIDRLQVDAEAYREAKIEDTITAYDRYLRAHPDGKYVAEIQELRQELEALVKEGAAYKFATEIDDKEAYRAFILMYPNGPHSDAAKKRLEHLVADDSAFSIAQSSGKPEAYDAYLISYPDGKHSKDARRARSEAQNQKMDELAYSHAREIDSLRSYMAYIMHYPSGRFLKQAKEEVERLQRVAVDIDGGGNKTEGEAVLFEERQLVLGSVQYLGHRTNVYVVGRVRERLPGAVA